MFTDYEKLHMFTYYKQASVRLLSVRKAYTKLLSMSNTYARLLNISKVYIFLLIMDESYTSLLNISNVYAFSLNMSVVCALLCPCRY